MALDGAGTVVMSGMVTVDRQALAWMAILLVFGLLSMLLFASRDGGGPFTEIGATAPGSIEEKARAPGRPPGSPRCTPSRCSPSAA
ncbi:hypothetical protein [Demequina litorisediminis]|uniref:Uncharacterized protein n=1 Tax=Demequina litorisediminis TaxID=1849022 RepID=A0ABQ6IG20_9MICO|nr:hypothetical protein [Demequina litorisediminis]GMA36106.1 hypothetical protein GCM10025876_23100 [Demequina litorisediminis]